MRTPDRAWCGGFGGQGELAALDDKFRLDSNTRRLFEDTGFLLFVSGALAAIVLVVAVSPAVPRYGVLPRWLGWAGLPTAALLTLAIAFVGFLVFALWVLTVSAALASAAPPRRQREPARRRERLSLPQVALSDDCSADAVVLYSASSFRPPRTEYLTSGSGLASRWRAKEAKAVFLVFREVFARANQAGARAGGNDGLGHAALRAHRRSDCLPHQPRNPITEPSALMKAHGVMPQIERHSFLRAQVADHHRRSLPRRIRPPRVVEKAQRTSNGGAGRPLLGTRARANQ